MCPLGVGINLQPDAVRELYDLGFTEQDLDAVGLPRAGMAPASGSTATTSIPSRAAGRPATPGRNARAPRQLHCRSTTRRWSAWGRRRCGSDRVTGYRKHPRRRQRAGRARRRHHPEVHGALLIGADGIHSAVRARCTRSAADPLGGAVDVARHDLGDADPHRRVVRRSRHAPPAHGVLPDLAPDPATGLSMINWIAEVTMDDSEAGSRAAGSGRTRSRTSRTISTAGSGTGSTCRRCCGRRIQPSRTR